MKNAMKKGWNESCCVLDGLMDTLVTDEGRGGDVFVNMVTMETEKENMASNCDEVCQD